VVRSEWLEPIDLRAVACALDSDAAITHVVSVQHETTTGRLNDIAALGELCRSRNVPLLLDAVSSFGGEWIDFRGWHIEGCAATANKCLHGAPGVSFVLVRTRAMVQRQTGAPCLYLDLFRNYKEQSRGYPLFTPPVQVMYALQEALMEMEDQGGWRERRRSYVRRSQLVRRGLRERGYQLLLPDERCYSSVLTSFAMPDAVSYRALHADLKEAGYIVYAGQGPLNGNIFRIAVMGELHEEDIGRFVAMCPRAD
jgi:2-aminoethylphosphonate-pyruvate transaminase